MDETAVTHSPLQAAPAKTTPTASTAAAAKTTRPATTDEINLGARQEKLAVTDFDLLKVRTCEFLLRACSNSITRFIVSLLMRVTGCG
jgi:hypothetical protein